MEEYIKERKSHNKNNTKIKYKKGKKLCGRACVKGKEAVMSCSSGRIKEKKRIYKKSGRVREGENILMS